MKKTTRKIKKSTEVVTKSTKKEAKESRAGIVLSDQFAFNVQLTKSREKPSRISFFDLRNLANNNNLVRICINKIKHLALKVPYVIRAKNPKEHEKLQKQIEYLEKLLEYPNSNDDTNRTLFSKVIEDVLIMDQGFVEKVRNAKGWVTELYHVDGATMKPNIDEYGLYKEDAYSQYLVNGTTTSDADFGMDDLMLFMINPQGQSGKIGYGLSPVESIVSTVVGSLQASLYNMNYFDDSRLPPAIVNLPKVPTEALVAFKNGFEQQLAGKPWSNAYTNADGKIDVKLLRPNNQEMQFYELNLWLARIIFAAFEVSPEDLGFTMDVNRATAQVQERITKQGGVGNMLDVIAEEINVDLINDLAQYDPLFNEIEFSYDVQDKLDEASQSVIDKTYVEAGVLTPDEIRIRMGLDPMTDQQKQKPKSDFELMLEQLKADKQDKETKDNELKTAQEKQQQAETQKSVATTKFYNEMSKWMKFYQ